MGFFYLIIIYIISAPAAGVPESLKVILPEPGVTYLITLPLSPDLKVATTTEDDTTPETDNVS